MRNTETAPTTDRQLRDLLRVALTVVSNCVSARVATPRVLPFAITGLLFLTGWATPGRGQFSAELIAIAYRPVEKRSWTLRSSSGNVRSKGAQR